VACHRDVLPGLPLVGARRGRARWGVVGGVLDKELGRRATSANFLGGGTEMAVAAFARAIRQLRLVTTASYCDDTGSLICDDGGPY
jgi:hypothetical protein